jgi:hypothetical protein
MVGGIVHCAECGKPFQAEDGSEVIQIARAVKPPFGQGIRPRSRLRRWVSILSGCAALFFLFVLCAGLFYESRRTPPPTMAVKTSASMPVSSLPQLSPQERWGELYGLPAAASLFGAIRFPKPLTLDDAWTQTLLPLLVSEETVDQLTPENLGRIQIDALALGYYERSQSKKGPTIVHLTGTALDGHRRIVEYLERISGGKIQIEEKDRRLMANGPVHISSPGIPLALQIVDDNHAYLAVLPNRGAESSRTILDGLPASQSIPVSYNPPWIKNAVINVPSNACGFLLGEIPAKLRKLLTESLQLRACPRTFVLHATREGDGVVLSLTLNVDKDGMERTLIDDLVRSRSQAFDLVHGQFPLVRKDSKALASLRQILDRLRWEAGGGSVRTQVRISGATLKKLRELLK